MVLDPCTSDTTHFLVMMNHEPNLLAGDHKAKVSFLEPANSKIFRYSKTRLKNETHRSNTQLDGRTTEGGHQRETRGRRNGRNGDSKTGSGLILKGQTRLEV
jgi:hypothetical protein